MFDFFNIVFKELKALKFYKLIRCYIIFKKIHMKGNSMNESFYYYTMSK